MHFSCRPFPSLFLVRLVAVLCVCSPFWRASSAIAQAEQILVVSGDKVPEKLSEAVSGALGDVGSVMNPERYSGNLRARGQEPDSDEALTKLAPQTGASLIVVLEQARNKVKVDFRNGHTGVVLDHMSVPARGKRPKLGKPARKKLITMAKRALSKVGPAPSKRASAPQEDFAEEEAPEEPTRPATATRQASPQRPTAPVAQADDSEEEEDQEQGSMFGDSSEEQPGHKAAKSGEKSTYVRVHAGVGLGSRSILVPTPPMKMLPNKVDSSFVPALDIGAALDIGLGTEWVLRFAADYRTIIGLQAGYLTPANMMAMSSLSSHSLIAGMSLGHLSDGRDSFGIHVFVGWAYRSLSASVPSLPSASVQGVVLRPELEIPLASRKVTLRLAPELILILVPNATLPMNDSGLAGAVGVALGAEASIDWHISQTFGLSAQFRESRGSTASGWGLSATENERYLALRLLLQF